MRKNRASIGFRVTIYILTALMIAFAFFHSSMPSNISSDESGSVLDFISSIFAALGISNDMDEHFIRKLAHFTEFTAIGALMTSCAYSMNRSRPYLYYAHILFFGLLTAFCDETIQLHVAGRAGLITDVWIDFSGVLCGTAVMLIIYFIRARIKKL